MCAASSCRPTAKTKSLRRSGFGARFTREALARGLLRAFEPAGAPNRPASGGHDMIATR